ncbi:Fic family protein [Streptomyces chartreusis]|uniref:Fic family protein n=1 Tax=Streptomyces chartreusis TaxID=1969 RepID=UPI003649F9B4
MQTELALHHWRFGQVLAERLCAGILRISGYTDIQPQAPLGGPDGKKDILVRRDGKCYIAAAYFPTTVSSFTEIREKYKSDLLGVKANKADGFVFLVNQHLTVGERAKLLALGGPHDEIFNVERMRAALDDPRGYGLRLEFLRIPMSPEEQVAFFNTDQQDRIQRLLRDGLKDEEVAARLPTVARLDSSLIKLLHGAMFENYCLSEGSSDFVVPRVRGGRIRAMQTYVVDAEGEGELLHVGLPPEQLEDALASLFGRWRHAYAEAVGADREVVLRTLAWFHHGFVSIMPFPDGNGRVARLILDQAAFELCRRGVAADLTTDRPAYFAALRAADAGDLNPLVERLRAALIG